MLEMVEVGPRPVSAYRGVAPDALLDELSTLAADLRGLRVLHVNATPYGGGVSELLRSTVPILNDLGIVAHWRIVHGEERFFEVTKKLHNGLQGCEAELTRSDCEAYLNTSRRNAGLFESQYDFVFLHDPQPAAILALGRRGSAVDLAMSHRHVDAESGGMGVSASLPRSLRRGDFHHGRIRSACIPGQTRRDHVARNRPVEPKESASSGCHRAASPAVDWGRA